MDKLIAIHNTKLTFFLYKGQGIHDIWLKDTIFLDVNFTSKAADCMLVSSRTQWANMEGRSQFLITPFSGQRHQTIE